MTDPNTVFALSSAVGRAAVAVLRISGPRAFAACRALAGSVPEPRRAALRKLRDPETGAVLDEALVLAFKGPASATGEDSVEFHVHGGRAVVSGVLAALGQLDGLEPAEPGAFARRAFANGKLDLTQAEGLADLIDAETARQRAQAIRQSQGSLLRRYETWRTHLIEAMALTEAAIDFSDEGDVAASALADAGDRVRQLRSEIEQHLASAHRGEIIREGYRVVLAGAPNVGKSSLLNALAGRDVAIVTEEAGTTRDVLQVRLDLGGLVCIVSDTAGLRETQHVIEREGIRRAEFEIGGADIVLWLSDQMAANEELARLHERLKPNAALLTVATKVDLVREQRGTAWADVAISSKTGAGLQDLTARIAELAADAAGEIDAAPPTTERHRTHLARAIAFLEAFGSGKADLPELAAEDLRLAAGELGRLTGRVDPEDVLDAIFGRFCIGK